LFNGRAGLIGALARLRAGPQHDTAVDRHARRLAWHALEYQGNLAFPGEQLLRLSMDLTTGNAGVLVALHAAFNNGPLLPFVAPLRGSGQSVGPANHVSNILARKEQAMLFVLNLQSLDETTSPEGSDPSVHNFGSNLSMVSCS
jgi:hypothetical protein